MLRGRGPPREAAAHERRERIGNIWLVAERLQQRQEELLGRIRPAIGEGTYALLRRASGDEVQDGGSAARRQPRRLPEDGDAVDPGPVERLEQRQPSSVPAVDG